MLVSNINDLSIILDIQKEAFKEEAIKYNDFSMPPMIENYNQMLDAYNDGTLFFKYIKDSKIVGSVRGKIIGNICHVGRLVILPEYQGQGIAKILMKWIESFFQYRCSSFEIFTGEKSLIPLNLYTKLGYQRMEEVPVKDYSIVVMRKENIR